MQQSAPTPHGFSKSKLYMWRCIVAMAHADNLMHDEEEKYLLTIFDNMRKRAGLSDSDYNLLLSDIDEKQDIATLLPQIEEPEYRGQVVYFARLLAYKDDHLDPSEEALIEKLHLNAMEGLDVDALKEEIHLQVQKQMADHDLEKQAEKDSRLINILNNVALTFGIDLTD